MSQEEKDNPFTAIYDGIPTDMLLKSLARLKNSPAKAILQSVIDQRPDKPKPKPVRLDEGNDDSPHAHGHHYCAECERERQQHGKEEWS